MYYKELNDYEVLDLILENNEQAKDILLQKYKPLVYTYAKKYYKTNKFNGIELEDLIQEGEYAIFKAIENYKITKNIKFCTYVTTCINRNIQALCRKSINKGYEILNKSLSYEVCEPTTNEPYLNIIADTEEKEPLKMMLYDDFYHELNKLKLDLDIECVAVFELRCNGFTYKEISKLLDITYARVGRCLKIIRKEAKKRSLDQFI